MKATPLPPHLAAFESGRFGYFNDDGRFVEMHGRNQHLHPKAFECRWVGGFQDAQLVRAILAEQQAHHEAEFKAQFVPEPDPTPAHDTPARAWAMANGVALEGEEA